MTVGMSSTNILGIGSGSDPWAAGRRPFMARDCILKGQKMKKIGLKLTQNGVWGRLTPIFLKGRVELIIKMHYPSGVNPGASPKSRFSLQNEKLK